MKICVLYHPNSEDARIVEEYAHDFERSKGRPIELLSLETREGADMAKAYDIVQYPSLMVLKDSSNELVKFWSGVPLPLMDEVASYDS